MRETWVSQIPMQSGDGITGLVISQDGLPARLYRRVRAADTNVYILFCLVLSTTDHRCSCLEQTSAKYINYRMSLQLE